MVDRSADIFTAAPWATRRWSAAKWAVRSRTVSTFRSQRAVRHRLASSYLAGEGLEIGALHLPLKLPRAAQARYVDRTDVEALRAHYPELRKVNVVAPDIIDDGERLSSVPDQSVDFVVANHFLEHCEDPIGAIAQHLRVVRPGGILYYAVPDKRETFDHERPLTELEHVVRDHRDGPAASRSGHYEEWSQFVDDGPPARTLERARELEAEGYSIHFHVWTIDTFLELLVYMRTALGMPLELQALERNGHEFVMVLRRSGT